MKSSLVSFAIAYSVLSTAQSATASDLYLEREDGSEITMYLKSQSSKDATDLLVLIQGSDCNSVAHNALINEQFSLVLPEADVLTVEKYGITSDLVWDLNNVHPDCPVDYIRNDSPERRTTDYIKVINQLKESGTYKRVVLIGGSEGAMVANMIAARADFVTASVALNGGGRKFLDTVLYNIKHTSSSNAQEKENTEGFSGFASQVLNNEPFELNMGDHGYTWWRYMLGSDQLEILKQIDSPLLIVQGGKDINVSPQAVDEQITKLAELNKTNVTYKSYPDMTHSFKSVTGESMVNQVITDIQGWLAQVE
ncbi:Alpha/beta hydrolase family protein [Pseudovibrio axinellae]|uniref:Alpha/beta hydrolase family protein n=1 Tax=Pseudovibrio axinellae TaxID=989403 RepID=A0A165VPZ9_9HYPH|nr:prolyl oligopeptidase family serine peptidase [Pseudovibrio axinellae]KZL14959.1 Alpha/beta hydrolase family protein [Pseudovibrio axinellae]SER87488.1 Prolyl oligopeptidase family protein [Pseudovibrio axinellae]